MSNESGETFSNMALSSAMQDILSSLLRTIITRRDELNSAAAQEPDSHPTVCTTCRGTGYLLVPEDDDVFTDISEIFDQEAAEDNGPAEEPPASPYESEAPPEYNVTAATAAMVLAALTARLAETNLADGGLTGANDAPNATTAAAAAAQPTVAPPGSVGGVAAASPAAPLAENPVVPPPEVEAVTVNSPIPGHHSLSGTAPPDVAHANFASLGSSRFYTVTRGIRVGVFGGWTTTSSYVTGVGGAAYIRHRTQQEALEEYRAAYQSGSVAYI